jgi:hypothetical protein
MASRASLPQPGKQATNDAKKADIFLKTKKISLNQIGRSQICIPLYGTVEKINNNEEVFIRYIYDRKIGKDAEDTYRLREGMLAEAA